MAAAEDQPTAGPDLSQAELRDGGELLPTGVHADGSLCYHGIAADSAERIDGGRWQVCADGQDTLTEAFTGPDAELRSKEEGWELVPTPCPDCGAEGDVEVRPAAADELAEHPESSHVYRCKTCHESGPARPRQQEPADG